MANEELKGRILAYICAYVDRNGFAPSFREIQLNLGVKSVSTVHDYVKRLEAEGRLDMKAKQARRSPPIARLYCRAPTHSGCAWRLQTEGCSSWIARSSRPAQRVWPFLFPES